MARRRRRQNPVDRLMDSMVETAETMMFMGGAALVGRLTGVDLVTPLMAQRRKQPGPKAVAGIPKRLGKTKPKAILPAHVPPRPAVKPDSMVIDLEPDADGVYR